jgi:hypothetical protein
MVTTVMADDTLKHLFDFAEADAAKEWQATTGDVIVLCDSIPRKI